MSNKLVSLRIEDRVGILSLNNPPVNVLNKKLLDDLDEILSEIEKNDEIKVIVLTGEGNAFAAGADIKSMPEIKYAGGKELALKGQSVFNKLEKMDKPSICFINGVALGGGLELAMSADMRVASEKAKVGQPEINLGIIPGYGGTQRLTRLIGKPKAKYLILTGDTITAEQAKSIGLVNAVYPAENAMEKVMETAKKMASKSMMALKYAKKAIDEGNEQNLYTSLETEAHYFGLACDTEDKNEGIKAFMEKRQANFQDK
mgnify:CR=1 FL=1